MCCTLVLRLNRLKLEELPKKFVQNYSIRMIFLGAGTTMYTNQRTNNEWRKGLTIIILKFEAVEVEKS